MTGWRDYIVKEFLPQASRVTLAADPDGLLLEQGVFEAVSERGYEIITFDDHVSFRYAYESRFRSQWDRGISPDLMAVVRFSENNLSSLPYDLLSAGRRLSFNLSDIFPHLSYPVIACLNVRDLDALYDAQKRHMPGVLGDSATKEFILRHVFEIAPELIKDPSDLLRILLRRHYQGQQVPLIFDKRLIQLLKQNDTFHEWPLEIIVPDSEAFFAFLQQRWPLFLDHVAGVKGLKPHTYCDKHELTLPSPLVLPFDHYDIRTYIDKLFLEGHLKPVPYEHEKSFSQTWGTVGILSESSNTSGKRVKGLSETVRTSIPQENAPYGQWLHLGRIWAELLVRAHGMKAPSSFTHHHALKDLQQKIDTAFYGWLIKRYAGLINVPPVPPVMVHHVPRSMAHYINESPEHRVALIVIDGLSFDQWLVMRDVISCQKPYLSFRESLIFAWIPTITSVSRQALFAAKPPFYFPKTVHSTHSEPKLWTNFWINQGLARNEVVYMKGLGMGTMEEVQSLISDNHIKVIALVIDTVDKIMHGMKLGRSGMYNQLHQWTQESYGGELFDLLLKHGFRVLLTSDHGNIEALGCSSPSEGVIADIRGQRVRIYSDKHTRDKVKQEFSDSIAWQLNGLPDDYYALIAANRKAFIHKGQQSVCHGGITVEEVIVPFVHIERRVR